MSGINFALHWMRRIERRVRPSWSRSKSGRGRASPPAGNKTSHRQSARRCAPAGAHARRAPHVDLSVHDTLDVVEQDWRAFQDEAAHAVFQSFPWLATWQRHLGARRDTGLQSSLAVSPAAGCSSFFRSR